MCAYIRSLENEKIINFNSTFSLIGAKSTSYKKKTYLPFLLIFVYLKFSNLFCFFLIFQSKFVFLLKINSYIKSLSGNYIK